MVTETVAVATVTPPTLTWPLALMVTGTEDPLEESEPRIRVVVTDCVLPSAGLPEVLAVMVQGLTVIF